MPWWGWVSMGIILMGVELTAVDAAFYLIFVGAAAVCVGLVGLAGVDLPVWGQLLGFAILAVAFMVMFRGRLYDRIRGACRVSSTRWPDGSYRWVKRFRWADRPGSSCRGHNGPR